MILTVDIVRNLIESMQPNIVVDSYEEITPTQWKANSCKTYWLRECREIEIDGFKYIVDSVDHNNSFTISALDGAPIPTILEFPIYKPAFYFGTRNKVNTDRQSDGNIEDFDEITPFAFLLSRITEIEPNDFDNPLLRESDIRIFFLESYNLHDDTTNNNILEIVLRQLHAMADYFIELINKDEGSFNCPNNIRRRQYEAFSEIGRDNGWYLDEPLAAVELDFTLPILKALTCEKC